MTGIPCPQTQTECRTLNPPTMPKPIISDALEEAGWGPPGILLSRMLGLQCPAPLVLTERRPAGRASLHPVGHRASHPAGA